MLIDLHVHTRRYSACSHIEVEDLIPRALAQGLDGLVLTEHGRIWPHEPLARLRESAAALGILILSGQEITCLHKGRRLDFLVFGVPESLGFGTDPASLVDSVHSSGGVIVAAHPYKPSRLGVGYHGAGDEILNLNLDAIELYHPDHDRAAEERVRFAAAKLSCPMTGGSDAHEPERIGTKGTRFLTKVTDLNDFMTAIRQGLIEPVHSISNLNIPASPGQLAAGSFNP